MVTSVVLASSSLRNTHPRLLDELSDALRLPLQQEKDIKGYTSQCPASNSLGLHCPLPGPSPFLFTLLYTYPATPCLGAFAHACPLPGVHFPSKTYSFFQASIKHHLFFKDRLPSSLLPLLWHLAQFVTTFLFFFFFYPRQVFYY